jgi:hypothetical protein
VKCCGYLYPISKAISLIDLLLSNPFFCNINHFRLDVFHRGGAGLFPNKVAKIARKTLDIYNKCYARQRVPYLKDSWD